MSAAQDRLFEAMLELVYEQGYEKTSVEQVLARAGVEREEFDRLFSSKEDCALAVFDLYLSDFEDTVRSGYAGEPSWPDNLRAGAYAVARWIEVNPRAMHFGAIEMMWVSELAQARRQEGFQGFIELIDAGRKHPEALDSIPAFTAEGAIGSIVEILTKRLHRDDFNPYELVPELMYLAVLPYLGEETAARELSTPPPAATSDGA